MSEPGKELGTIVVVVLKARNLRDKHTFTKQDPFVSIQLGKTSKKTEIDKRGGQHPVWDQDLHIPVPTNESKDARTMKVSCFAKEPKEDDLIGAGEVDITEILKTGEFDDWVKIEENGSYRGEVYLEMTFFAAGPKPKPLVRRESKMPTSERLWRPPQSPPKANQQLPASLLSGRPPPAQASTSPKHSHLAPPRSSRTPSPSSKLDPLPPLPEEVYRPVDQAQPQRAAQNSVPPPAAIPSILKPGGGKPRSQSPPAHRTTLPTQAIGQVTPQPVNNAPQSYNHPPVAQHQHTVSYNSPASTHTPAPTTNTPAPSAYTPALNTYTPALNTYTPAPASYTPAPTSYAPAPISYTPAPVSYTPAPTTYTQSPSYQPPAQYTSPANQGPPQQLYSALHTEYAPPAANFTPISFPEPNVQSYNPVTARQRTPSYPDYIPGSGGELEYNSAAAEAERERLAKRYGSPLPVPGGASSNGPKKPSAAAPAQSARTSRPALTSTSPTLSTSTSASAPPTNPTPAAAPDPYLERERAVLNRANQEEADAELARMLAQQDGVDLERLKREEADRELARKLARELNAPIIENERRRSTSVGGNNQHVPGEWNGRNR